MTQEELDIILEKHNKWLKHEDGGERANLSRVDLSGANLSGVCLSGADLSDASLSYANLSESDLSGAKLSYARFSFAIFSDADLDYADFLGADLYHANLSGADLYHANLSYADLSESDLSGANLSGAYLHSAHLDHANLSETDLSGANLSGAYLLHAINIPFVPIACPDSGSFTGWKKAHDKIVKLIIPEDAKRLSGVGRKCRCDKAVVVSIENLDGSESLVNEITSDYDNNFIYKVGETVVVPDFDENRFNECSRGIHFFVNRQEAVDWH